jgi:hypothetical protein
MPLRLGDQRQTIKALPAHFYVLALNLRLSGI